jgi:hypothetical protein
MFCQAWIALCLLSFILRFCSTLLTMVAALSFPLSSRCNISSQTEALRYAPGAQKRRPRRLLYLSSPGVSVAPPQRQKQSSRSKWAAEVDERLHSTNVLANSYHQQRRPSRVNLLLQQPVCRRPWQASRCPGPCLAKDQCTPWSSAGKASALVYFFILVEDLYSPGQSDRQEYSPCDHN